MRDSRCGRGAGDRQGPALDGHSACCWLSARSGRRGRLAWIRSRSAHEGALKGLSLVSGRLAGYAMVERGV